MQGYIQQQECVGVIVKKIRKELNKMKKKEEKEKISNF